MRLLHQSRESEPAAALANSTRRPRILLIAYHFPPSTVVGALRWDKLVHALSEQGYAFDVITLEPAQAGRIDMSRLTAMPGDVRVFGVVRRTPAALRVWHWAAHATKRLRSGGRPAGTSAPRAEGATPPSTAPGAAPHRVSWARSIRMTINARLHVAEELDWAIRAARAGVVLARQAPYHCVVTSGPPHFAHHAGYLVSSKTGLPHVPDFRDPWRLAESTNPDHNQQYVEQTDRTYESRVVGNAACVVMNTEAAAIAMRELYPARRDRIHAIMNGSDPEDRVESPRRDRFTLLYAGSLYLQRDPRVLFRACESLVREQQLRPEQFAIQFLGPVSHYAGRPVPELAEPFGLRDHVIMSGMVPRPEALAAAAAATMLVCLPDGQKLTIPAKLFEYLQLDAWLLAFAEPSSAMAMALEGVDADVVAPGDIDHAARCVRQRWHAFASGVRPVALGADGRFLRSAQAVRLAALLHELPAR